MTQASSQRTVQTLVGAIVTLTGLGLAVGALTIPGEAGYGGVGPNFLPWLVAGVLLVCGVLIVREALTGGFRDMGEPSGAERPWWPGLVWVSAGLLANAALITTIGFILSCTLCYLLVCRACGAPRARRWGRPRCGCADRRADRRAGVLDLHQVPGHQPSGLTATGWIEMDIFSALLQGFATAISPINLLWAFVGCVLGTAVGVLPGIGPAVAVAMLLPITAKVDITASMIFFAGIYYGAMYGGSTTSILLNTPGETASMVTAMEGNKMAKSGRAGQALATAAIGSFIAGTIATVLVTLFAPAVADFAVKLGPRVLPADGAGFHHGERGAGAEHAARDDRPVPRPGPGLVGMDQISGQARYTGGVPELLDGVEIVLVAVGLFAVAEVLYFAMYEGRVVETQNKMSRVYMSARDWRRARSRHGCAPPSSARPSAASGRRHEIPTFLSYAVEKKAGARTRRSSAPPARSKASPGRRRPTTPP